jgi:WD40 repeat protein
VALLDSSVREKEAEVRSLRQSVQAHSCAASPRRYEDRDGGDDDGEQGGREIGPAGFWVPTDPVVMQGTFEILCLRFAKDTVVTGHGNGFICVWDVGSAQLMRTLRNGHTARVEALDFDGFTVVSGGFEGAIRRWDVRTSECTKIIHGAHRGHVKCVYFDALNMVSAGTDALIHVWDAQSFKHEKTLTGHKSPVTAFAVQGNSLVSAEWGWVFVWDVDRAVVTKALRDEIGGICAIDFRGSAILTGGSGGRVVLWDANTGTSDALDGHQDDVMRVQIVGEGFAVSCALDATVRTWDVAHRHHLGVFANTYPDEARCFHLAANRIAVGAGRTIKVWTR